jgi:short subunit dehydrogenase-like uncharacterized protein
LRALVLGGYGVFGSIVSRELALRGVRVTVAGRGGGRAAALASTLGEGHAGRALDLRDARGLRSALEGHAALVSCAGPFHAETTRSVLEACLDAGVHYADIADERESLRAVRAYGARFAERALCAVYGASSLPGLSAALAVQAAAGAGAAPRRARLTLFIGNDNAKGGAAIASLLRQLGRPIAAPQGTLRAGGGRVRVPLPAPLGPRTACDFDGPEHDLLPELLGVTHVEVKVGFELPLLTRALGFLGRWRLPAGERAARWLARLGNATRRAGSSAGAVMAELEWADGASQRAALVAERDGQRLAALPCVLAVEALLRGRAAAGALLPHEVLGAKSLLQALSRDGATLHTG